MYRRLFLTCVFFQMFVISAGFMPSQISLFVPFACGAERLTFGLRAEEPPSDEIWKKEFAEISSKSTMAMSLSTEELQALVVRCDKLRPIIDSLEEGTTPQTWEPPLPHSQPLPQQVPLAAQELPQE